MENNKDELNISIRIDESIKLAFQEIQQFRMDLLNDSQAIVENMRNSLLEAIKPSAESMIRINESVKIVSEEISEPIMKAGFWISPSSTFGMIKKIKQCISAKSNSVECIRNCFIHEYSKENYKNLWDMVISWETHTILKKRMNIINAACRAHIEGDYYLSIPTLLPVVEGVLSELARGYRNKAIGSYAETIIENNLSDIMKECSKEALIKFVTGSTMYGAIPNEYFHPEKYPIWLSENGLEGTQILNRHAILHGVQINYSSVENSLRAFLLLDSLSEIKELKLLV